MASIKLGAFVTDIAGSVGGSTFRRSSRNIVLYNKQRRQIKSAFSKNSVKSKIGIIFASWNLLSQVERDGWNLKGSQYVFRDKFGNNVYLSGRELFNKLNTQLIPFSDSADLNNWHDNLQIAVVTSVNFTNSNNHLIVQFDRACSEGYLRISAYPLRYGAGTKPSQKFFPFSVSIVDGESSVNVISDFEKAFPFASSGQKFGFNIQFFSLSGFESSVQAFSAYLI